MRSAIASTLGMLGRQSGERRVSGPKGLRTFAGTHNVAAIPVLVVSMRNEDHQRVRESLETGRWLMVEARDWGAALSLSQCLVFPVIVCDCDYWRRAGDTAFRSLAGGWRTASVVLLSDQWDPGLWESLLEQGGFDLLMRPLHQDDVLAVLDAAYRQWADGRPGKAVPAESSRSTVTRSRTAS